MEQRPGAGETLGVPMKPMEEWSEEELRECLRNPWGNRMGKAMADSARKVLTTRAAEAQGTCGRYACESKNLKFYNKSTRKFYCGCCAAQINRFSVMDHQTKICVPLEEME